MSSQTITQNPTTAEHKRRERGSGGLIPPRLGISRYWTGQVYDVNGKAVRRSLRAADGKKVEGKLIAGRDPRDVESWTNITAAREALKRLARSVESGTVAVGSDPTQMRYADLRALYLQSYAENKNRSLLKNAETGEEYVCGLKHLDKFFGYEKEGDIGCKVSAITTTRVKDFKAERTDAGAAPGTINRSLAALRRMFTLAQEDEKLQPQHVPTIKMLAEPEQPRAGFLEVADYDKLHNALPDYVQPILQVGFYTGMRLGEIVNLKWGRVHLEEVDKQGKPAPNIRLLPQDCKNKSGRYIPLDIDGLPEMFEALRQKNPTAGENEPVFLSAKGERIGSFLKAWRNACVKAAIKTTLNGEEIVSHFEEDGTYRGFIFHDLRRSAVRNLVMSGTDRSRAKAITGHKTDEVFERYDIKIEDDLQRAGVGVGEYLNQQRAIARGAKPKNPGLRAVKRA